MKCCAPRCVLHCAKKCNSKAAYGSLYLPVLLVRKLPTTTIAVDIGQEYPGAFDEAPRRGPHTSARQLTASDLSRGGPQRTGCTPWQGGRTLQRRAKNKNGHMFRNLTSGLLTDIPVQHDFQGRRNEAALDLENYQSPGISESHTPSALTT